ncbi:MAG TPA: T9SS type A sorting domain-containing protein [Melioribacteraceae bacterium]|nr:T9SS type A sorting domain-containing protein [Melioribacteraceae bacterium]
MKRFNTIKASLLFLILFFADSEAQWMKIDIISDARPAPSLFLKDGIIYAGSDNRIYRSSDNGVNWKESNIISPDVDFISALIKHDNKIFVGTYNHGVFYSSDEGITWNSLNTGLNGLGAQTISEFAVRGSDLYAGTYGGGVFVTDLNALSHWNSFSNGLSFTVSYNINSIKNIDGTLYAGAGGNSSFFKNRENSDLWEEVVFGEMWGEPNNVFDIIKMGDQYIISASYGIYTSSDGVNWNYFNTGAGVINESNFALHNNRIYAHFTKGAGRTLWITSDDNGKTWNFFDDQRGIDVLSALVVDNKLFAGRVYGFNYRPLDPTSVDGDELPAQFELSQNYPNPFNPSTTINFSIDTPGNVELKIYDITGREVAALINQYKPAGNYSYRFNPTELNLSSGVYFYKLSAGEFSSVKKMILMK